MQEATFGDSLKKIRLSKGDSVRKVALYAGISASYYSQIENNKRQIPKPATLRKIATGLHISETEIFKLANLIPAESPAAKPVIHVSGLRMPADVDLPGRKPTQSAQANKIGLTNSRQQLHYPLSTHVNTQLPPWQAQAETIQWLKITDTNLVMLGILKSDLAVISTAAKACQLIPESPKLMAFNLTTAKTTVRQTLITTDQQVMLTTGLPTEKPLFLTLKEFKHQLAGAVINLYRDLH